MTHLEHQVFSTIGSQTKMANIWRECAVAAGPPVVFMGLTIDYQQDGFVQVPTVYGLLDDDAEVGAEEARLRPLVDSTIAEARARYDSITREDLYCDRDKAIWNFETADHFHIRLFTARAIRDVRAADEGEKYSRSPGQNVAARHPAEVARIEDYDNEEFHVFYHNDAIWTASVAAGINEVIGRELIEYCHKIGRSSRTLENTRIIFTSLEELSRDYIGFYK